MELAKSLADSLVRYALTITDERIRKDYLEYSAKWQSRNYRNTYISDAQSVYPEHWICRRESSIRIHHRTS